VVAFLREQDRFNREQNRKKEDRDEELSEIEQQFAEERHLRQREFTERRAQIEQEILLSQNQTAQKIADTQREFQESQRLREQERQLELQRLREDQRIADERSRAALQRSLNDINLKAQAEIRAISATVGATQQLLYLATKIAQTAATATSSQNTSSSARIAQYQQLTRVLGQRISTGNITEPRNLSGRAIVTAFARGGVVRRPSLALIGEKLKPGQAEAVIPFQMSRGLPAEVMRQSGGMSQNPIVLHYAPQVTIGEFVSRADVEVALQATADNIESQLASAFSTARNNPAV
jgi:hypothetical protein